jgi:hypothetical protein
MNRFLNLADRMRAAHGSWQMAVEDLTLDHVNHHERHGVLPISFSLMHLVNSEDYRMSERLSGNAPVWDTGGWAERVGVTVPAVFRGTPVEVAETLRFANLDAWRSYQTTVFAQTQSLLRSTEDARWDEVYLDQVPNLMSRGFLALLCGSGPVTLGNYLEVVVYHHSLRHLGELEHARALVGLGGVGG